MDLVLKLRELRRLSGLSQKEVAEISGIGEKSISSFETGERVDSMKIYQLQKLVAAYGVSIEDFFGGAVDVKVGATVPKSTEAVVIDAVQKVAKLPSQAQRIVAQRISDIVAGAELTFS